MIIKLTDEGMLRADGIAADLFTVEFLLKTDFSSKPH
jgi:hypothetical protein